jgi:protein-S-isoprenylcysteine O-methyltransferase Ste14
MARKYFTVRSVAMSVLGVVALGALICIPAGTFNYWQGWLFLVVFTVSTQAIGIYLAVKDPALLERRMQVGPSAEQRPAQRIISALAFGGFLAVLVVSALDYRFGWSPVPVGVSLLGDVLVVLGLFITLLVLRENTFSASNIRVEQGQTVISTGPYGLLRHPMYAGALMMAVGVPLALDSWLGLLVVALMIPVLVWRILDEETLLEHDLSGYREYAHHVRFRLVPFVW